MGQLPVSGVNIMEKPFKALPSSHTQSLCRSAIFSRLHEDKQGPSLVISRVVGSSRIPTSAIAKVAWKSFERSEYRQRFLRGSCDLSRPQPPRM